MNRIIYLVSLVLLSCVNDDNVKYYTYEKWSLPEEFENSYLKDNPKEVTDIYYVGKSDSSLNTNGKLNNYDYWKFDYNGNIIFHKYSSNSDSFWIITKYIFTNEGLQSNAYYNDTLNKKSDGGRIITSKKANNFLETVFRLDKPQYSIISFSNNGNVEKQEFIVDTNNLTDILRTQTSCYTNDMIQKKELITNDGYHKLQNYFYSKEKSLDSVLIYTNGKLTSKEIFYNNQFGDPVKYAELDSLNDTTRIAYIKYGYDQHNNWIKQLVKEDDKSIYANLLDITKSKYSLSVREIKY